MSEAEFVADARDFFIRAQLHLGVARMLYDADPDHPDVWNEYACYDHCLFMCQRMMERADRYRTET